MAARSAVSMYGNFFFWLFREPFPRRQIGQQIVRVMLEAFGVINWSGAVVIYMLLSETTILIAGAIFASKIGTAFTVEIGSMQMSGQLDALRLMAVEPVQYIVIPRVLASIFCFIVLKTFSDGVAIGSTILFARCGSPFPCPSSPSTPSRSSATPSSPPPSCAARSWPSS